MTNQIYHLNRLDARIQNIYSKFNLSLLIRSYDQFIFPSQHGPSVLSKSRAKSSNKSDLIKSIVQVFVDSLPHIPEHRRLHLLTHLLERVGADQYLYLVVGLIAEKQVINDEVGICC